MIASSILRLLSKNALSWEGGPWEQSKEEINRKLWKVLFIFVAEKWDKVIKRV